MKKTKITREEAETILDMGGMVWIDWKKLLGTKPSAHRCDVHVNIHNDNDDAVDGEGNLTHVAITRDEPGSEDDLKYCVCDPKDPHTPEHWKELFYIIER